MDIVLQKSNEIILNSFYNQLKKSFEIDFTNQNSTQRQCFSLWLIAVIGVNVLYFTLATLSFYFLFDKRLLSHPKVLFIFELVGLILYTT